MSRYEEPDDTGAYPAPGGRRGRATRSRPSKDAARRSSPARRQDARPPRKGRRGVFGRHPVLSVIAIVITVALTGGVLTAYGLARNVYDRIHIQTISNSQLEPHRPPELVPGALNILLIGSDSRQGIHGFGKGIAGSRSDTSMLLHISPNHAHAIVVSFPRDAMVPIYACKPDGQGHPGQSAQPGALEPTNWTFSFGGVACLWRTIEQTTQIHIDAFAEVDFTGFKQIVNDVGGVPVCLPFAINDPASRLHLPAGRQVVMGAQALAFVRERHIGQGSDLQRIQRQQFFLASAIQKIKQTISSDPTRLYSVIRDAAASLTTSMSLTKMIELADSLKNLSTKDIRFIQVPVVPYPPDPGAQVQWMQPQADQLFSAIRHDNKVPKSVRKAKAKAVPTVSPGKVDVQVLNGTNTPHLAGTTAAALAHRGFKVAGSANASSANYAATYIEYGSASQYAQAETLAKLIPGVTLKEGHGLSTSKLTLILGSKFKGLKSKRAKSGGGGVVALSQNLGGISANTNICKDSGAFSGPDTPSMFGG